MSETVMRVERLANGYTVEVCDPAVMAKNKSSKGMYSNPWKEYAFSDDKTALAFITKILPTLKADDSEAADAFDEACSTEEGD
jgi:hypothetical protein